MSNHPTEHKAAAYMIHRMNTLSISRKAKIEECSFIKQIAENNGFTLANLRTQKRKALTQIEDQKKKMDHIYLFRSKDTYFK
jgi:hypothetical protein